MRLRQLSNRDVFILLALVLAFTLILSACLGATSYSPAEIARYVFALWKKSPLTPESLLDRNIFLQLRLPRVLLCALTGAVLSVSGTLMQGLFRNPIVEPGLVGTSAGAALGASLVFVLGGGSLLSFTSALGPLALPVLAFLFSLVATLAVYRFSSFMGKPSVATMILAGIAVNAVALAGTGMLSYIARDPQARSITFWTMGSFAGADWQGVGILALPALAGILYCLRFGKWLNALMLGEEEAAILGADTRKMTREIIIANTLMVAVATSLVGVIAFIGLVVPHLLRILRGSDNRFLIPGTAILGAILMEWIDMVARLIIAPAELPVGIITAIVGAPVFLWILIGHKKAFEQGGFYA